ncbi:hypothetical protein BJ912DRAFT_1067179 [Pholiota molesta]|nr:hypothetical protein BJ912DRAFT_1067179 [Pholiota molesta]
MEPAVSRYEDGRRAGDGDVSPRGGVNLPSALWTHTVYLASITSPPLAPFSRPCLLTAPISAHFAPSTFHTHRALFVSIDAARTRLRQHPHPTLFDAPSNYTGVCLSPARASLYQAHIPADLASTARSSPRSAP